MDLLNFVALVLLTLVGYSGGAVMGASVRYGQRGAIPSATLLDTLVVAGLWVGGIVSRRSLPGRWTAIGVWFVIGFGVAFVVNLAQGKADRGKSISH